MIAEKTNFKNGGGFNVPVIKYIPGVKKYELPPLVIFCHGNGEVGDGTDAGLSRLFNNNNHANILKFGDDLGFHVLAVQFVQKYNYVKVDGRVIQTWRPEGAGGTYLNDAIDWAKANLPVDPKKIIITGLSGGGGMVLDHVTASQEHADKVSCCIPICATEQAGTPNWEAAKTVPMWFFHGDADTTIHVDASVRQAEKANAKLTIIPGAGHSIWGGVYGRADLWKWALEQDNEIKPLPEPIPIPKTIKNVTVEYSDGTKSTL